MKPGGMVQFGVFRLDPPNARLWNNDEPVPLTPKAYAVLTYLIERAGQLVTKDQLLKEVWEGTVVSDAALTVCVREIRKALDDSARQPQFIETVHRRGYRFKADVVAVEPKEERRAAEAQLADDSSPTPLPQVLPEHLVGRDAQLHALRECLEKARQGDRQLIFITGEEGAGKSALAQSFLHEAARTGAWCARGQCFEHQGDPEPYVPVFEILAQLSFDPRGRELAAVLGQLAPSWLARLPALRSTLPGELPAAPADLSNQRLIWELTEALESLTKNELVVLFIEDLHWGDPHTLDLLAALSRPRKPSRLLLLATGRAAEDLPQAHPVRVLSRELATGRRCLSIPLSPLEPAAVDAFLMLHLRVSAVAHDVLRRVMKLTGGHPLYVVSLIEHWQACERLTTRGDCLAFTSLSAEDESPVPPSIRAFVSKQLEQLPSSEQAALEAASVAGVRFSSAAVAAALETDVLAAETQCEALARRQRFLQSTGVCEWPDGTVAGEYEFPRELEHLVLQGRVPAARRVHWHGHISRRLLEAHGPDSVGVIPELIRHFEGAHDYGQAIAYLREAVRLAFLATSPREAQAFLARALQWVDRLPEAERGGMRQAILAHRFGEREEEPATMKLLEELLSRPRG